jgi:uncharacterized membrane protein HdeD (DUF308 family)
LAVPLIALIVAVLLASYSVLTEPEDSLIKGWDLAQVTFSYALLIALPVGAVLAIPTIMLSDLLPNPRWAWLVCTGACLSVLIGMALFFESWTSSAELVFTFAAVGAVSAALWWLLVDRHRREPAFVD